MTLTVDADKISGVATTIDEIKYKGEEAADTFSYTAKALFLEKGTTISL
jgi:hypothetical protein